MSRPKQKLTETDIRRQVTDYLQLRQYFCFYVLQGLGAYKGIPDLNCGFVNLKEVIA